MKFLWTTIPVSNLEESVKFYSELIGLALLQKWAFPPTR